MKQYPVAREGWIFVGIGALLTAAVYWFFGTWAVIPALLTGFVIFFFRNPEREIPVGNGMIVSPADGRVLKVENVAESKYIGGEAQKVSIFLSLFNVHINRIPVQGQVEYLDTAGTQFLAAYKEKAPDLNVRKSLGLATPWGRVMVVQITGLVARRIVSWAQMGDLYQTGDRFGLIRFGSCTEVYLPKQANLVVKPGDRVKAGESVIGRFVD
ncbi:MAG: phosphatidylserine decarboxylase family protein [Solirubrobacterales bacterium]